MEGFRDVASVIPYNRRYSGFVGGDIYDAPRQGVTFAPHFDDICRMGFGRSEPLPYKRRCSGFVGGDIYDDPR